MRYCRTHYLKNPLSGIKFALSVTRLAESPENDGSMLSQHSLNKGRSKRLVSAVAALSLFFGAAHVAPTASAQEIGATFSISEDQNGQGYRIKGTDKHGKSKDGTLAELFVATPNAGGTPLRAYCNELEVNFHKTNNAYAAKWEKFPGDNNFKTSAKAREKINWIAANSYPAVDYEIMLQKVGATKEQVSEKSMIAQTQAAIWHLGSDFKYEGLTEGTAVEQANAKKVYDYLISDEYNTGRAESTTVDVQVGFEGEKDAKRQPNGIYGPFTLKTNADSVEVTAETGQVVDKDGKAFPANEIKKDQEFYFKAEEEAGEAKLIAKAASSEVNGSIIISPKEGNAKEHHQTLIVTHDKSKTKNAELSIKWKGTNARISTTAHKEGDEHSQRVKSKGGTIIDVVAYEDLIVGKKYTMKGQMYERVKQEDGTYKGVPTDIKAQKEFTPTQPNDEVHLQFEIPEGYAGKTLVVFEENYGPDGKLVATHADINDENQTIYVNQPYQDMSSDSSAAKTGSAGAMFAGSSKCFSGGAAGGSSKKEDKNKGSLGDLFAGSSSLFGGDKDKDKGGSDSNNGSTNGGNGQDNGGSNTQNGSTGGTIDSSSNKDKKDNGSTGGGDSNGNGGGNGGANGGSDTKTGSNAGGDAGSGGGVGSSDKDKDKKDNGSNTSSSGDNKGNGNGQGNGGSDGKSGSDINSTSDTKGGSAGGAGSSGNGKGDGNGGSTAGSSGEGKGQGNGGANGGSDTQNGSDSENKNGSAALAGSTSGADCGALALGALVIGGLVLTATGFSVLPKNAAPAPLAGAADPKSDTKGAAPAAGDPNNKNATNSNTKGAEPKEKGVAHKDPNTSKMDVKSASPAKSNSALANTGVSGILIMLAIAAVAAVAGGALIFFGRRKKN